VAAGAATVVVAVRCGLWVYFATFGDMLKNCDAERPNDAERCGNVRLILNGVIEKHLFAAVAGSILRSAVLIGGAWVLRRTRAPA
jgi:hypothetical protein